MDEFDQELLFIYDAETTGAETTGAERIQNIADQNIVLLTWLQSSKSVKFLVDNNKIIFTLYWKNSNIYLIELWGTKPVEPK